MTKRQKVIVFLICMFLFVVVVVRFLFFLSYFLSIFSTPSLFKYTFYLYFNWFVTFYFFSLLYRYGYATLNIYILNCLMSSYLAWKTLTLKHAIAQWKVKNERNNTLNDENIITKEKRKLWKRLGLSKKCKLQLKQSLLCRIILFVLNVCECWRYCWWWYARECECEEEKKQICCKFVSSSLTIKNSVCAKRWSCITNWKSIHAFHIHTKHHHHIIFMLMRCALWIRFWKSTQQLPIESTEREKRK